MTSRYPSKNRPVFTLSQLLSSFDVFFGELSTKREFVEFNLKTGNKTYFPFGEKKNNFPYFYTHFLKDSLIDGEKILLSHSPETHDFYDTVPRGLDKALASLEPDSSGKKLKPFSPEIMSYLKFMLDTDFRISSEKNPFNYQLSLAHTGPVGCRLDNPDSEALLDKCYYHKGLVCPPGFYSLDMRIELS
ncbi:MAG: hypothetical protein ACLFTH_00510 [Candidatus Woesearchaeota archaeon]